VRGWVCVVIDERNGSSTDLPGWICQLRYLRNRNDIVAVVVPRLKISAAQNGAQCAMRARATHSGSREVSHWHTATRRRDVSPRPRTS
jgi:hypothetical protein